MDGIKTGFYLLFGEIKCKALFVDWPPVDRLISSPFVHTRAKDIPLPGKI